MNSILFFLKTNGSVILGGISPAVRYNPDEESGAAAAIRFRNEVCPLKTYRLYYGICFS